jgi:hypothetical protein
VVFNLGYMYLQGYAKTSYGVCKIDKYIPYILESNPHPVFAAFLNEKKLVHRLYHFSKIQL